MVPSLQDAEQGEYSDQELHSLLSPEGAPTILIMQVPPQLLVSVSLPGHFTSPRRARDREDLINDSGTLQILFLCCRPPLQVEEQELNSPHSPHTPVTEADIVVVIRVVVVVVVVVLVVVVVVVVVVLVVVVVVVVVVVDVLVVTGGEQGPLPQLAVSMGVPSQPPPARDLTPPPSVLV